MNWQSSQERILDLLAVNFLSSFVFPLWQAVLEDEKQSSTSSVRCRYYDVMETLDCVLGSVESCMRDVEQLWRHHALDLQLCCGYKPLFIIIVLSQSLWMFSVWLVFTNNLNSRTTWLKVKLTCKYL